MLRYYLKNRICPWFWVCEWYSFDSYLTVWSFHICSWFLVDWCVDYCVWSGDLARSFESKANCIILLWFYWFLSRRSSRSDFVVQNEFELDFFLGCVRVSPGIPDLDIETCCIVFQPRRLFVVCIAGELFFPRFPCFSPHFSACVEVQADAVNEADVQAGFLRPHRPG